MTPPSTPPKSQGVGSGFSATERERELLKNEDFLALSADEKRKVLQRMGLVEAQR